MSIYLTPIIIAKAHGKLREGLASLLENHSATNMIDPVEDEDALFRQMQKWSEDCIVLLDIDLFGKNTIKILKGLQIDYPHIKYIILVNTFNQKKIAFLAGFNHILIKGFDAKDLLTLIGEVQSGKLMQNDIIENNQDIRL